jgi:hypothetical protein
MPASIVAMRRARVLLLWAVACLVLGSVSAPRAETATRIVLVSKCGNIGVQRPREIVFACADAGLKVQQLRWSAWGGRIAVGRGVQMANDCNPSCVAGHFHATPVTLHLYKRRPCPGRSRLYYLNVTFITPSGQRSGGRLGCPN